MEFKIDELRRALRTYESSVGAIKDNSDRVNTNKRQAFINAFYGSANIYDLRDLFRMKDTNNVRYAVKKHEEKYISYLDYCDNYRTAEAIKHMFNANKVLNEKIPAQTKTSEVY